MEKELVLVTGGSGFIAVHIILKLLKRGYRVRTTLRTLSRQDEVKSMLAKGGAVDFENLEFIQTDLTSDINWIEAVTDANYVIHVASPTPATRPDDGDEMVKMAVDGTLRVMKAAKAAGVKRVVLTSASGAVLSGHKSHPEIFTEEDWTDLSGNIDAYQRSKTMAELAAWEFAKKENMELSAVNPVAVMGPVLGQDFSHSNQIIRAMLKGDMPFLLNIGFDYVDVRDVAELHLLAMTCPEAAGERFIATTGENLTYKEEAKILQRYLGSTAKKVSTKALPDFMIKFMAIFKKDLRMPATFLGQNTACSNAKAKKLLGWQPRPAEEAIVATAKSMIELGLIDK
ncbi:MULTISPECIES: SDR family oxidoreductase [Clostridium]|jgi:nucleoside-diphosphate-sugar epimerase|uniref:Aldehyde reductase n=3 Tax=Clostridium beijerinckii TaxID=1520 RepID=A0AB74VBQ5_CLOBE|nr:aldehyde reductase [Clostridium beijerinckii]ABR35737.1 NAD-dependent epimerase/dehydratase [Clostridium beijerinckii NCIMB 8052]AIU02844.1 NAD-dependent epimerase/dehydratase [Clostridium beijerinckii ATCC 35702]MBF7809625.1 aldehyde reductase [Clostridium beijerinckii]OOM27593.1 UDP-glucose 4-epimerase [Clostridium beijerinckii]OOM43189.1 UDP-glucose 4-epimerase [Clostridium beijerinckii]